MRVVHDPEAHMVAACAAATTKVGAFEVLSLMSIHGLPTRPSLPLSSVPDGGAPPLPPGA